MIRRYVGLVAILLGAAGIAFSACSSATPTDFAVIGPVRLGVNFASFAGPGIWESVPPNQRTYKGTVDYLVEALDNNGRVLVSYNGRFKRPKPDFAGEESALISELVTILVSSEAQMRYPVPSLWLANPRYMIPSDASAVRITVDPRNRIREQDESNNVLVFSLPSGYGTR